MAGRPAAGATDLVSLSVPDVDTDVDNLTAARAYAAAGWYVLPVKRGSKSPGSVVGDRWQSKSSRDLEQIVAWFAGTDYGIALHCGRSGAVVFDVDDPSKLPGALARCLVRIGDDGAWVPQAPYQSTRPETPGRGHYVFAMPPGRMLGNGAGRLGGAWGEVRGANGVIIAAPTQHPDGGRYEWICIGEVPVLPNDIAELLDDASPAEDAASDEAVAAFLADHAQAERPEILAGWVKALTGRIERGDSCHDSTVSTLTGAMKEARAGYFRATDALTVLKGIFISAVALGGSTGKVRKGAIAASEFAGILAWAVGQANAADLDEVRARTDKKMPLDVVCVDGLAQPEVDNDAVTHSAHLGMATKLGKQYTGNMLYVNNIGWHTWDGKRWAPDSNGAARRAVHAVIKRDRRIVLSLNLPAEEERKRLNQIARYETASAITGILTEAAALQAFSVTVDDLDADPYLLNCANGTLDLRTMELRAHDPGDRITKVANAAYDPYAVGTTWAAFLNTVLPDEEVRDYLQRVWGVSLLGEVNGDKQILPIMTGGGANGKTTAIEAGSFAMGDYAMTAEPTLLMEKRSDAHPTGIADLMGRRFVSVCETEQRRRFDIALLKWLTGGDTIKARLMRQDFFSFTPSHLLVMATNHLPRIDDDTEAVWRRIRVIPFTVQIPKDERDKHLKDKLRAEADAVLTWIIEGWTDYRRRCGLDEPDAVMVATDGYKADSDAVGRFIEEECLTGGVQSSATTQALHDRWVPWQVNDGALPLSRIAFGRALDAKGYPAEKNTHDRLRRRICLRTPKAQDNDAF